jgi:hypothetical protein
MPKYHIDWSVSGTWEVNADSPEDAQAKFDKDFGSPRGVVPLRDGEVHNSKPYTAAD